MASLEAEKTYTEQEVAEMLGCARETLRRMRSEGLLKPRYLGVRNLFYLASDVNDFLHSLPTTRPDQN